MKRIAFVLALALLASCKQEVKEPSVADTLKAYTIAQMMDNESVGGGYFSPDNSQLLVHSNRSGIYNVYTVSTADGTWMPVTASDSSSAFAISYFPEDDRKLFRMGPAPGSTAGPRTRTAFTFPPTSGTTATRTCI